MGDFVPRPLIKFQYSSKLLFSQFQIWILRQCGREHAFERSCLFEMFAPNICTNIFQIMTLSASASGDCVPKTTTKLYTSFTYYNHCWFVHECEQLSTSLEPCYLFWNICFKYAPKWMVSSLMFQKMSGEEHRAPSPNPFPRFRFQIGLHSQFMGASHPLLGLRPRQCLSAPLWWIPWSVTDN